MAIESTAEERQKADMRWRNLERSKNVEDRRGRGGMAVGGVGGFGIIGLLLVLFLGGGRGDLGGMGDLLGQLGGTQQPTAPASVERSDPGNRLAENQRVDFIRAFVSEH